MGRDSLEAEVAAVKLVAIQAGLGIVDPKVLSLAKHTTLRLAPLPIVARVQSSERKNAGPVVRRELEIASCLAVRRAPTVRPVTTIDPGPYRIDGCIVTLWDFIAGRRLESDSDATIAARALQSVHEALDSVDAELPSFMAAVQSCGSMLSRRSRAPTLHESDRAFLNRLYANLREELDGREFVSRKLHGDAHLNNALMAASGVVWMDLEAVCTGPLEWDVVSLPPSARSEFGSVDLELMRLLSTLRSLCVTTWCWADFDRSSETAEAAVLHLDRLRQRFG